MSDPLLTTRLRTMLTQIAPGGQLPDLAANFLDVNRDNENPDVQFAAKALQKQSRGGVIDPEEQRAIEAIVLPHYRPAINIINDTFNTPPFPWESLGTGTNKDRIDAAIPSIGRIEAPGNLLLPYLGTGFMVGPNLMMTNRHIAEIFATGVGQTNLTFRPGQEAAVDFKREAIPTPAHPLNVERVVMIHPYWDMALIRVTGLPLGHPTLRLSITHPEDLSDHDVVAIGYPAPDDRNDWRLQDQIFDSLFYVKRLSPGKLKPMRTFESFGRNVNAVTHDCSTLGGNSGSAVIDVATGEVVALHFAGVYLDANFAVPMYDLAGDSRVVQAGVSFVGNVDPSNLYAAAWREADSVGSPPSTTPFVTPLTMNVSPQKTTIGVVSPEKAMPGVVNPENAMTMQWTIPIQVSITVAAPIPTAQSSAGAAVNDKPFKANLGELIVATPSVPMSRFSVESLITSTTFDWQAALSLALASKLAYSEKDLVLTTVMNQWGMQAFQFFDIDDTECFIASNDSVVLVAFRGTESVGDWLADLDIWSTDQLYGTVHRGFRNAFEVVKGPMQATLTAFPTTRPIVMTGHSLGGALATIAAVEWRGLFPISRIYTFGQPAVGKGTFPSMISQGYPGRFFRFVNDNDIVPQVPPSYLHVGKLIHFDELGKVSTDTEAPVIQGPPVMSEADFDRLRARLLAERAQRREAGAKELPLANNSGLEGFLPSISEHSIDNYLTKIAAFAP